MYQRLIFFMTALLFTGLLKAEVIEFPEEELSQETVLPVFENPEVVKNRNVITAQKIEISPYLGFNMTEPIYNQSKLGVNIGYHWSEVSAFIVNFAKWNSGLNTQYTDALKSQYNLDFSRAPKINYSTYFNYEYKAYYGKISLTKQGTMNLTTYPLLGFGMTSFENKNMYGVNAGVGQKFYFNKHVGLRIDLKMQYAQAPSPFLKGKMKSTDPVPTAGEFQDQWGFSTILDLGVGIVF
jgi:outer membrane beta-barrel protein